MKKYKLLRLRWFKVLVIAFFLLLLGAPNVFAAPTPGEIIDSNCPKGDVVCILKTSTINTTISVGNFLQSTSTSLASGWSDFTYGLLNNITDSITGTKEFAVSVGDGAKFIGNGIREGWTSTENFVVSIFDKKTNSLVVAPIIKTPTPITVIPPPVVSTPTPPIPTPIEIIPVPKQIIQSGLTGQMGPRGLTGLQGPRGEAGRDGNIVDTSSFISKTFLDAQVAGIYDSIGNSTQGLPITLTTTGTSGASTLIGNTLNIPQYSSGSGMVYPSAGIALSTGSAWGTSISGTSSQFVKGDGSLDSTVYGAGTVTTIGVTTANGVSGSSSGGATPSLTIALGDITPTSVNGLLVNQGTNSISGNTAVGALALDAANSGTGFNTAVGYAALTVNTSGSGNTAIGYSSLSFNTIGYYNTAIGFYSLNSNNAGTYNTANGYASLNSNTTGSYNTALGYKSLYSNITGTNNVALGYSAGRYELGSNAFYINNIDQTTTANDKAYSLLYGTFSGTAGSLTGQQLVINGKVGIGTPTPNDTLQVKTSGQGSISFGGSNGREMHAYDSAGNPSNFDIVAATTYFNGDLNVGGSVGSQSGMLYLTKGTNSFGLDAQYGGGTGDPISFVGNSDLRFTANIGPYPSQLYLNTSGNVGIGTMSPTSLLSVGSSSQFQVNSSGNIVSLNGVATSFPASNSAGVLTNNGSGTLTWVASGGTGTVTAVSVTTANGVSGSSSGGTTPSLTIALGAITPTSVNGLLVNQGTNSVTGNTAVGALALDAANSGTGQNTAVGYQALTSNTTGFYNSALGYQALYNDISGSFNSAQGNQALYDNTTGSNNTAIGYQAGYSGPGVFTQNTLIGSNVGNSGTTPYLYNTAIGYKAGFKLTGNSNVMLGMFSGAYELGSNAFYINNVDQANTAGDKAYSLLYGQFSGTAGSLTGQQLTVNGALNVNGNVGIGMTPAYKLDVNGAINATSVLINGVAVGAGGTQWASGSGGVISYTGGNVGIGTPSPTSALSVGSTSQFQVNSSGNIVSLNGVATSFPASNSAGVLTNNGSGTLTWAASGGSGTVTAVSVATANGVSGTSSGGTTPSLTIALGAITPTSINGLLVNQGTNSLSTNTAVGALALDAANSGNGGNTAIGYNSLSANTSGYYNTAIGVNALTYNTTGNSNTTIGFYTGFSGTGIFTQNTLIGSMVGSSGSTPYLYNTAIGYKAGYNLTGNYNVMLGQFAGAYELGSNAFYVNNIDQTNTAGDKAYSLLYGQFSGTAGSLTGQQLTVNGALNVNGTISTATGIKNSTSVNNAYVQTSTTGIILSRNVADANSAVTIQQQNSSSSGPALTVTNSGTGYGAYIDQGTTGTGYGFYVNSGAASANSSLGKFVTTNATFNQSVLNVTNAGTGTALDITNNSTGTGIKLNQYGTGYGLYAITDVGAATSGLGRFVATNAAFNQSVLSVSNAGTGTALDISNSGTGYGINLNQSGTGYGFYVNSGAASANSSLGKFVTTNATFNQSVLNVSNAGTGTGLDISQGTTGTGTGLSVYSNVDATSNSSLAILNVDNAAFDNTVLSITNDGIGTGINLSQNGTGTGLNIIGNGTGATINTSSSTLTSGSLANFTLTGTGALTGQKGINVSVSGANGTVSQTTYGAYLSNTHTGTSTNVGLYATATGGTNNYAAVFPAGNVGIGTTSPTRSLDIFSTTSGWGMLRVNNNSASKGETTIGFFNTNAVNGSNAWAIGAGGWGAWTSDYDSFTIGNDNGGASSASSVRMLIQKTGNVGIGTISPLSKLSINGGLHVGGDSDAGDNNLLVDGTINGLLVNQGTNSLATNTAVGVGALDAANSGGGYNTAFGNNALTTNTTGADNTATGAGALYSNAYGNSNTANGSNVLTNNTSGSFNTADGYYALDSNFSGNNNTATGVNALTLNSAGNNNVAFGMSAGKYETGSNAFYINNIDQVNTAGDKAYSLLYGQFSGTAGLLTGQQLTVNGTLKVNGTIRQSGCIVAGTLSANTSGDIICTSSSIRFKNTRINLTDGLSTLIQLQPVSYIFNDNMNLGKEVHYGFISEEVNSVNQALATHDATGAPYGLDSTAILAVTVNAIKEMNLKVNDLSSLDTTSATSLGSLITSFLGNETARIGKIFTKQIDTKTLCVSDDTGAKTCINKAQLDALMASAGGTLGSNSGNGTPPVVEKTPTEKLQDANAKITNLVIANYTTDSATSFAVAKDVALLLLESTDEEKLAKVKAIDDALSLLKLIPICTGTQILVNNICTDPIPADPTCTDGIQNQDETGVDTGGVCGDGTSAN